jgi:hypothetical protein
MSDTNQLPNAGTGEKSDVSIDPNGYEALVRVTKTLEDLKRLYRHACDAGLSAPELFTQFALDRILLAYRDDLFMLFSYAFDEREHSEFHDWPVSVTDGVFQEVLKQCKTLTMLRLLYKVIPGEANPGVDENYHQRVVEKMICVAGDDHRKLYLLHKDFFDIEEFRSLIETRINEVVKK